jgi:hypothetical protein
LRGCLRSKIISPVLVDWRLSFNKRQSFLHLD